MKKLALLLLASPLLSGCGTLLTIDQPTPFSGTQHNIDVWEPCHGSGCMGLVLLRPLSIIDFPFSLAGDVLMLPVKGIQNLAE